MVYFIIGDTKMAEAKKTTTAAKVAAGKKTTTAKPKTTTAVKPKTATKAKSDLIVDTAHKLENLTKVKAYAMVSKLAQDIDFSYFQLGGVLSVIQSNGWYTDEGFDNFKSFVEEEYGLGYRKAMYMVGIYNGLVEANIPWEKVEGLGWSKLKELCDIINEENVDEWVEIASELTVIQLQAYIKEQQKGSTASDDEDDEDAPDAMEESTKLSTLTFKVHDDQKEVINDAVDKAKNDADTEFANVAMESICLAYLSGNKPKKAPKPKSLKDTMKGSSWEEVLEIFEELWPDVSLTAEVD